MAASSGASASAVRAASSNARSAATHAEMTGPADVDDSAAEEPDRATWEAPEGETERAVRIRAIAAVVPPPAPMHADRSVEQMMTASAPLQVHETHRIVLGRVPCVIGSGPYESTPIGAMNVAR